MNANDVIARLREFRGLATKGKWSAFSHPELGELSCYDAAAIVAAMNSLPALLECAEALEGMLFFVSELPGAQYSAYVTNASAALDALSKDTP
jgi:hypothetical protein